MDALSRVHLAPKGGTEERWLEKVPPELLFREWRGELTWRGRGHLLASARDGWTDWTT
jgi:hypothetical protein